VQFYRDDSRDSSRALVLEIPAGYNRNGLVDSSKRNNRMNKKQQLLAISHHYGSDPAFLLAGGGNSSYKNNEHLYIKASGAALSDITEDGFVCLNRKRLAAMWDKTYPEDSAQREAEVLQDIMAAREPGQGEKRPSVETLLHDLFDSTYVLHTHPPLVNALTCSREGRQAARRILGDSALWIPSVNPGHILAVTARKAIRAFRNKYGGDPDILLLQNHGLCVPGENFEQIRTRTERLMRVIQQHAGAMPALAPAEYDRNRAALLAPAFRMLLMRQSSLLVFHTDSDLAPFLENKKTFAGLSTAITPDHIVYCGHEPLFIPKKASLDRQYEQIEREIEEYRRRNGAAPLIICVQNLGVFAWGSSKKAAEIALSVFLDALKVAILSRSFGGLRPLPARQIEFIRNWEVEAFRKRVGSAGICNRMAERIAIVTGAAQGFGAGIAESLLKAGMNVVLADLNESLASLRADQLNRRFGEERCLPCTVDVSEADSVAAMCEQTALSYGGVDLLVSNAGVLKAGSLAEMDTESFEFVNRVNYRGFFLCCKYGSETMKIQHRFRPNYFMDIVQINSKSGLSGSNKNFAYAGSKFGGIGLTQSFALELVEFNIKVNAICPGNYFDGPLWSDAKRGLFVQYLRAGKVPGAKTIEDVRGYYESKVPMRRGCRIEDVARAVVYIVDQIYETGQALPVTGGQVMLR